MKIYNTLEKADIPFEDIQNLKAFTSREGFMLVDNEEYEELQKFFQQFSLFNGLCPLLSDGNSNYWCVFTKGARKGLVCYLNHEEQDRLEPRFKNISRLLVAIEKHPDASDFDDLSELLEVFDFPNITLEDFSERETMPSYIAKSSSYLRIIALTKRALRVFMPLSLWLLPQK